MRKSISKGEMLNYNSHIDSASIGTSDHTISEYQNPYMRPQNAYQLPKTQTIQVPESRLNSQTSSLSIKFSKMGQDRMNVYVSKTPNIVAEPLARSKEAVSPSSGTV